MLVHYELTVEISIVCADAVSNLKVNQSAAPSYCRISAMSAAFRGRQPQPEELFSSTTTGHWMASLGQSYLIMKIQLSGDPAPKNRQKVHIKAGMVHSMFFSWHHPGKTQPGLEGRSSMGK